MPAIDVRGIAREARAGRRIIGRMLLADRQGAARRVLASLIRAIDGVVLAAEVGDREELPLALGRSRSDVLVIDDRLRHGDHVLSGPGPQAAGLRVRVPGVGDDPAFAARVRRLGAEAWIGKDRADEQLLALPES